MSISFLYMPDISGFTEFLKQTEIVHSQHIISELLEVLIDANELDMVVAEIEGDAVLFYTYAQVPPVEKIIAQARKMFLAFHNHLKLYETHRVCQCGACSTASNLSLKIIAHAGEVGFIDVKGNRKPHGSEVISIHNLLKNSIAESEYLLITENLFGSTGKVPQDEELSFLSGEESYPKTGSIKYSYVSFKPLFKYVVPAKAPELPAKIQNPVIHEGIIKNDAERVFEVVTNLDLRLSWNRGVDELIYKKKRVNRVGTKHTCLINGKHLEFETVSNDFGSGKLVYGERISSLPIVKEFSFYYILEKLDAATRVRIEVHYVPLPVIGGLLLPLFKRTMRKNIQIAFEAIQQVCEKELKQEGSFNL